MSNKPRVSVCIPVHNGEKYTANAIRSVLDQTYGDFELVVVDNASTDRTLAVVSGFSDRRIRVESNETDIGLGGNFNRCLALASGEYVLILCHDDYLERSCIEEKVAALENDPDVVLVFSASNIVDEQNKVITTRQPYASNTLFAGRKIARRSFLYKNIFGEPSNVLFRRSAAMKAGSFDERLYYCIDWDFWIRVSLLGKVFYVNKVLMNFRVSNSSASSIWMKSQQKLEDDDKKFIENCIGNEELHITKTGVCLHRFNIMLRTIARRVVFRFYNNEPLGKRKSVRIHRKLYFPKWVQQFFKFGLVGITNTLVGLAVYYSLVFFNVDYFVANVAGFLAGVMNSYLLNKKFVFKIEHGSVWKVMKVLIIYGFSLLLSSALLYVWIHRLSVSKYIAPIINLAVTTPLNFLLNKHWAFREKDGLKKS